MNDTYDFHDIFCELINIHLLYIEINKNVVKKK